jgi:hypothetical protein
MLLLPRRTEHADHLGVTLIGLGGEFATDRGEPVRQPLADRNAVGIDVLSCIKGKEAAAQFATVAVA